MKTIGFQTSGATDHVTNDLPYLSINSDYTGSGKIYIGNGTGVSISHVGHTSINSNSRLLHLKNLLRVPLITKNLLSLSQFSNKTYDV